VGRARVDRCLGDTIDTSLDILHLLVLQ